MSQGIPGELIDYPTGQIQIGAGDLQHAASCKTSLKNNGKLTHTLRRSPSGFVKGVLDCEGSIDTIVPADGPEYDYIELMKTGSTVQFRFKVPASNVTIEGRFTTIDLEVPLGDTIKLNLSFVGKHIKS